MAVRLTDLGITEDIKVNAVATDYATKLSSILGNGVFNRTSSVVSSVYLEEVSSELPEAVGEGEHKPLQAQSEYARHEVNLKKIAGRVAITEEADALLDGLGYTPSAEMNRLYHKMVGGMLAHLSEKSESEGTLVPSVASFEDFARYASLVDADSLVISTREMKEMSLITNSVGGPMFPLNGVSVYGLNVTVLKSDERFAYFYKSSDSLFTLNADKIIRRNPYSRLSENVIEYIFECHYSYDFIRDTRVKRVTFGEEYETGDGEEPGDNEPQGHVYPVLESYVSIDDFVNGETITVPFHFSGEGDINSTDTFVLHLSSSQFAFYSDVRVGRGGEYLINEMTGNNNAIGEGKFHFSLSDKSVTELVMVADEILGNDILSLTIECVDSSGNVVGSSEGTVSVNIYREDGGEDGGEEPGEFYLTAGDGGYFEVDEESSAEGIYAELTFEGDPSAWTSSDLYHIDFEVAGDAIVRGFVVAGEELPEGQYSIDLNPLDQPQSPVSVMILLDEFSDGSSANVNIDVSTNGSYESSSTYSINMVSTSGGGGGGEDMVYLLPTDIRYTDDPIRIDTANGNNEFTLELPFEGDITAGDPNSRFFTVTLESYDGNSQFTVLDSDGGYMDSPGNIYFTEVNPERSTNDPFILNVIVDSVNGGQDTLWVETITGSLEGGDEQRAQYYTLIDANGSGETENPDESEENVFAFDEEGTLDVAPESGVVRVDYNHLNPSATSDRTHILKVSTSDRIDIANMKEVLEDGTEYVRKQGMSETGEHILGPEWGETYELELAPDSDHIVFSTRERDPDASELVEIELITKDSSGRIVRTSTKTIELRTKVLIGTHLVNQSTSVFDYASVSDDNVVSIDFGWTGKVDEALNDPHNSYIIDVPVYPFSSVDVSKPEEQKFQEGVISFIYDGVSYPNEDSYSEEAGSHVIPVELSYDNAAGFTVNIEIPSYQDNEGYVLRAALYSALVDTIGNDLGLEMTPYDSRLFFLYREGDVPEEGYGTPFNMYDGGFLLPVGNFYDNNNFPFRNGDTYKIVSNDPILSDPRLKIRYSASNFPLSESSNGEWNKIATVPVKEEINDTGNGGRVFLESDVPQSEIGDVSASCYFLNIDSTGRVVYKSYARLPVHIWAEE